MRHRLDLHTHTLFIGRKSGSGKWGTISFVDVFVDVVAYLEVNFIM